MNGSRQPVHPCGRLVSAPVKATNPKKPPCLAGRSSFHHAYRRLVIDALPTAVADRTLQSLAALMKVGDELQGQARRDYILAHTLIRKIERSAFDVEQVPWNLECWQQVPRNLECCRGASNLDVGT